MCLIKLATINHLALFGLIPNTPIRILHSPHNRNLNLNPFPARSQRPASRCRVCEATVDRDVGAMGMGTNHAVTETRSRQAHGDSRMVPGLRGLAPCARRVRRRERGASYPPLPPMTARENGGPARVHAGRAAVVEPPRPAAPCLCDSVVHLLFRCLGQRPRSRCRACEATVDADVLPCLSFRDPPVQPMRPHSCSSSSSSSIPSLVPSSTRTRTVRFAH